MSYLLLFQVETDNGSKKYVIYNVQAAETDEEHKTTEENDLLSFSISSDAFVVDDFLVKKLLNNLNHDDVINNKEDIFFIFIFFNNY